MSVADERTGAAPTPTGPLSKIDYSERIPNNVNLAGDRRLQRALESWQPKFLDWWKTLAHRYRQEMSTSAPQSRSVATAGPTSTMFRWKSIAGEYS